MFVAEVFILVLMLKSQYEFNLSIALAFYDSKWVMLWVMVILLIAQNGVWNNLINEYITEIFKEKLPGFQGPVVFTIQWLYFYFSFRSWEIISYVNGNTLNTLSLEGEEWWVVWCLWNRGPLHSEYREQWMQNFSTVNEHSARLVQANWLNWAVVDS